MLNRINSPRLRVTAVLVGVTTLAILCFWLVLHLQSGETQANLPDICVSDYSDEHIMGLSESAVRCTPILSSKINHDLTDKQAILLRTEGDLEAYLKEYQDIHVTFPEQVDQQVEWFENGFIAIVFSCDKYPLPGNLIATSKFENGTSVIIGINNQEINPKFEYDQPVENCQQASVIIYLKEELLKETETIEFLLMDGKAVLSGLDSLLSEN